MKSTLFGVLVSLVALRKGHAVQPVTWQKVGCTGWTFNGANIDDIWDNAHVMVTNAQSAIASVPTNIAGMIGNERGRRSGANANFMYGTRWSTSTGTDAAGTATLSQASALFAGIQQALEGTLTGEGFTTNTAFIFCGGNGLTRSDFPGNVAGGPVWNAQVPGPNGQTQVLIPSFAASANAPAPCTETGDDGYVGKTFNTIQTITTVDNSVDPPITTTTQGTFTGIILCPNQFATAGITVQPTLALGFTPTGTNPNPNQAISLSGTLVHEMAHVVGRSRGRTYLDPATGFNRCVDLGNLLPATSLVNPDTYRIFAEMCMAPTTKWFAPPPAATTRMSKNRRSMRIRDW